MGRSAEALAVLLADRIAEASGTGSLWASKVREFLRRQSSGTLSFLEEETQGWSPLYFQALDASISNYLYEYKSSPFPYPEEATLPKDEFFLRLAAALVPVSVEHNLPSLDAQPVLDWDGQYSGTDLESLCQSVSAEVEGMFDSLTPNQKSLRLCRGYLLNGMYGGGPLGNREFEWLHDNASVVMRCPDGFFRGGRFDLGVALEIVSVRAEPLRTGVL